MDSEANCVLTNMQEVLCDNVESNFPNPEGSFTQSDSHAGTVCGINLDGGVLHVWRRQRSGRGHRNTSVWQL